MWDLGEEKPIRALWLQADANDSYTVSTSLDGNAFVPIWLAGPVAGAGQRTRFGSTLPGSARFLRLQAYGGDGLFSVGEVMAFAEVPQSFPPAVPRRAGRATGEVVRTSFLFLALALVVWLAIGRRGGATGWLAGLGAVVLAGAATLETMWAAWPLAQRDVSFARGVLAGIAAIAVLWDTLAPRRLAPDRRAVLGALGVCGTLGALAFWGFGQPQFHDNRAGAPTFVHLLDLRQYSATAKYFPEIGYRRLYEADVLAYSEDRGRSLDSLARLPVRDLRTNEPTTVRALRPSIESVKERFSPERWEEYKRDARVLRETMGEPAWLEALLDLGGNATPVWMSVAYLLFNAVPAEPGAWRWLALLDPLLFVILFAAIGFAFGVRTMLVCMTIFGANDFIMFGTNWGGAVLRHDWLVALGLGIVALRLERWMLGGALLGLATSIRAFPALAVVGLSIPGAWWIVEHWRAEGRPPTVAALVAGIRPTLVVGASAVATVAVLALVSGLLFGFDSWADWLAKVRLLDAQPHVNPVSLRSVIVGTGDERARLFEARWPIFVAAASAYVLLVVLAARRRALEPAATVGLVLLPVLLYPSNYYLHLVMLLPLVAEERPGEDPPLRAADGVAWAVVLGICAAQYFTTLVSDFRLHFHFSSVLLMAGLAALLVAQVAREVHERR